jgi:hypothetical protein
VAPVEIIPLGDPEPFYVEFVNRSDYRMYRKLVVKKLIKVTTAAAIFLVACPEVDTLFHMVQAGPPGCRE